MFWYAQTQDLDESFQNPASDWKKVHSASSYGHFIAEIEFWSQCHILARYTCHSKSKNSPFSKIALNRVLRLPDYSWGHSVVVALKIIDFENKNISVVRKHWKYRISAPMLYIAFVINGKTSYKIDARNGRPGGAGPQIRVGRRPGARPACPRSPGGPWAQYIRSGPEGARCVLECVLS